MYLSKYTPVHTRRQELEGWAYDGTIEQKHKWDANGAMHAWHASYVPVHTRRQVLEGDHQATTMILQLTGHHHAETDEIQRDPCPSHRRVRPLFPSRLRDHITSHHVNTNVQCNGQSATLKPKSSKCPKQVSTQVNENMNATPGRSVLAHIKVCAFERRC
jgi:hypothetical protein